MSRCMMHYKYIHELNEVMCGTIGNKHRMFHEVKEQMFMHAIIHTYVGIIV